MIKRKIIEVNPDHSSGDLCPHDFFVDLKLFCLRELPARVVCKSFHELSLPGHIMKKKSHNYKYIVEI